jgi:hypothetical protein
MGMGSAELVGVLVGVLGSAEEVLVGVGSAGVAGVEGVAAIE